LYYQATVQLTTCAYMYNLSAGAVEARTRTLPLRLSSSGNTQSPPLVTIATDVNNHGDPSNSTGETLQSQIRVKRTVSDIERPSSTERRNRQHGGNDVGGLRVTETSSNDLMEFLAARDSTAGLSYWTYSSTDHLAFTWTVA